VFFMIGISLRTGTARQASASPWQQPPAILIGMRAELTSPLEMAPVDGIAAAIQDSILSNAVAACFSSRDREGSMLPVLIAAIEGRRLVSLWYDPGVRVVEPYVVGYGSDGQVLLRAFQVWGASASHQPVQWKLFRLDRIRDAKLNDRRFRKPR